jgi:hypothetical protein
VVTSTFFAHKFHITVFIFASFVMNPPEKAWSILPESARQLVQEDYQVFSKAETNAIDTSDIESQEQLGTIPASQHDSMAAQCTEVTSPFILKDLDGDIILAYYPNRIPQNLAETANKEFKKIMHRQFNGNLEPPKNDIRHRDIDPKKLTERYGKRNFGTIRCECWFEEGTPTSADGVPSINRDMCNGSTAFDRHTRLIQVLSPLKGVLSDVFAAASPLKWRNLVNNCSRLEKYLASTQCLFRQRTHAAWSSFSLVVNLPTHIHMDNKDAEGGLTGMCSVGSPCGMWLVIFSAGLKFKLDPEYLVLFNPARLPHFIHRTESGKKHAVVRFFNHKRVVAWVSEKHENRRQAAQRTTELARE